MRKKLEKELSNLEIEVPIGRHASVALILQNNLSSNDVQIALMKRAIRDGDPWSGQISLPGGHLDKMDRDFLDTAIRETYEEVGVSLGDVSDCLGRLQSVEVKPRRPNGGIHVHPFVFWLKGDVTFKLNHEATRAFWLSFNDIQSGVLDGKHRFSHLGKDVDLPCWNHQGEVIWGLTHRIIEELNVLLSRVVF